MKNLVFLVLVITNFLSSMLQGQVVNISGYVKDGSGIPIPFASIAVFNGSNEDFVGGSISDSTGFFRIKIVDCPEPKLSVSAVAHISDTLTWSGLISDTTLNTEIILEMSTVFDEITISAQYPLIEHKLDRIVFNVPSIYRSAGNTAWDVIKKTPGLTTNSDGVISVGSKGFTVMINDRIVQMPPEQAASLLQNLTATDIASIEIIHTPPPQFDAQNGGLINIVLKKSKEKSWFVTLRNDYIQATYPKFINGLSLQINHNKWNVSAQYMNRFRTDYINEYGTVNFNESRWNFVQNRLLNTTLHQYRLGIDYHLSKHHALGVLMDGFIRETETKAYTNTRTFNTLTNQADSSLFTTIFGGSRQYFQSINLHYLNTKNPNLGTLSFDIDYVPATDDRKRVVENNSYAENSPIPISSFYNNQFTKQGNTLFSIKSEINSDFKMLDTIFNIYYGIKWNKSKIDNYQTFSLNSNSSLYDESIFSTYAGTSGQLKNIQFHIGARGEHTTIRSKFNLTGLPSIEYFNLFPAVYLGYPLSEKSLLNLSYGKRLSRPDFWRLNPFIIYQNPYIYTEGNPTLKPSYLNTLELKYVYKNSHIFSLFLNRSTGNIATLSIQNNSDNTLRNTYSNLGQTLEAGLNLSSTFFVNDFWQSNNYFQLFYKNDQIIINSTANRFNIWYAYFSSNNSFFISKDRTWVIDVNSWYGSPSIEAYQYLHENWEVSLGISKQLCKGRLNCRLDVFDVFYTNINRMNINFSEQRSSTLNKTDTRSFAFRVTYKFGNNLLRERRPRRTSLEDEKKRTIEQ